MSIPDAGTREKYREYHGLMQTWFSTYYLQKVQQ